MLIPRILSPVLLVGLTLPAAAPIAIAQAEAVDCSDTTPIYLIQGAGHVSALTDTQVTSCGVVTAVGFSGYYIQDVNGDENDATSDGIYVAQRGDKPAPGTHVRIAATVSEIIGGGPATGNLSTTTLTDSTIEAESADQALPAAVVVGEGGRLPPLMAVISDDEVQTPINLQLFDDAQSTPFNPDQDSMDFLESLEGMLVSVTDATAISATRQFGRFSAEVFILADASAEALADRRTVNNGILLPADPDNRSDQNAARLQIQFDGNFFGSTDYPAISVGDRLTDITGIVSYSFGNYEIVQLGELGISDGGSTPATATLAERSDALGIASYNVLNLSAVAADDEQRGLIAEHIANSLGGPAIVALQEVQDNNGDIGDCPNGEPDACAGVLDATETLQKLVDQISAIGGPAYDFATVDPLLETRDDNREEPDTFGGASLGNIRNAFIYDASRVSLVSVQNLTRDVLVAEGVSVPTAFDGSRDPLDAIFTFNDKELRIINNHFSSRFGSTPIFGGPQPFVQAGEDERSAQSRAVHEVVSTQLANNPEQGVVVLGDLNTFEFTDELTDILPAANGTPLLINLHSSDQASNAYSFNFEGNSQALDHIFVSENIADGARVEYVHVNVDFPRLSSSIVGSDHDPVLAQISFSDSDALGLRGEVYGSKALELFWNRLPEAVSYRVSRDGVLLTETQGVSLFESDLARGTLYEYEVVGINNSGRAFVDSSVALRTRGAAAEPPSDVVTDLTGAVYSSSAVEIFWRLADDADNVKGFDVLRDGELVATNDGRSFFEEGLQPGTSYRYEVAAFDDNGRIGNVASIELTTRQSGSGGGTPALPQVASFTGLVYSSSALEVFWAAPDTDSVVARYEVLRDGELLRSEDVRSVFDSDLESDTTYTYSVRGIDSDGNRGAARELMLTTRAR